MFATKIDFGKEISVKILIASSLILCFFVSGIGATPTPSLGFDKSLSPHYRNFPIGPAPLSKQEKIDSLVRALELVKTQSEEKRLIQQATNIINYLTYIKKLIREEESWEENRDRLAPIIQNLSPEPIYLLGPNIHLPWD
jgi:hypothetical protein